MNWQGLTVYIVHAINFYDKSINFQMFNMILFVDLTVACVLQVSKKWVNVCRRIWMEKMVHVSIVSLFYVNEIIFVECKCFCKT